MAVEVQSGEFPRLKANFIPQDANWVLGAMKQASDYADLSFISAHLFAPFPATFAVAGSLVNTPIYLLRGACKLGEGMLNLDPKQAFKDLSEDMYAAMQSLVFAALGVFYVFAGIVLPHLIFKFFAPVIEDAPLPEITPEQRLNLQNQALRRELSAAHYRATQIQAEITTQQEASERQQLQHTEALAARNLEHTETLDQKNLQHAAVVAQLNLQLDQGSAALAQLAQEHREALTTHADENVQSATDIELLRNESQARQVRIDRITHNFGQIRDQLVEDLAFSRVETELEREQNQELAERIRRADEAGLALYEETEALNSRLEGQERIIHANQSHTVALRVQIATAINLLRGQVADLEHRDLQHPHDATLANLRNSLTLVEGAMDGYVDQAVTFSFALGAADQQQITIQLSSEDQIVQALDFLTTHFSLLMRAVAPDEVPQPLTLSLIEASRVVLDEVVAERIERTWTDTYIDWVGERHSARTRKYRVPTQLYLSQLQAQFQPEQFLDLLDTEDSFQRLVLTLRKILNDPQEAKTQYLLYVNTLRLIIMDPKYKALLRREHKSPSEQFIKALVESSVSTRWGNIQLNSFVNNYLMLIIDAAAVAQTGSKYQFPELTLANFSDLLQDLNDLVSSAPAETKKDYWGVKMQQLSGEIGTADFTGYMNVPFARQTLVFENAGHTQEVNDLRFGCPTSGGSWARAIFRVLGKAVDAINPTGYRIPEMDGGEEIAPDFVEFVRQLTAREGFLMTIHQSRINQSVAGNEHQRVARLTGMQNTFEHLHVLVQGMDGDFYKRKTDRFEQITTFDGLMTELVHQFTQNDGDYGAGKVCDLPRALRGDGEYPAQLRALFETVHQTMFQGRAGIAEGSTEWQAFINFCYAFQRMDLNLRLSTAERPIKTTVNFCKDNIDRGPAQAIIHSILFLVMSGEEITHEKLKEIALSTLANAPFVKGKEMRNSRLILARNCLDIVAGMSPLQMQALRNMNFSGWKPQTSRMVKLEGQEACPTPNGSMTPAELYDSLTHLAESRATPIWEPELTAIAETVLSFDGQEERLMHQVNRDIEGCVITVNDTQLVPGETAAQDLKGALEGEHGMTAEEALRAMSFLQQNAFVPITAKLMHNLNNGLLDLTVSENKDKPHIEFVKGGETVITVRKGYVLKSSDAEALQDHEEKIFAKFGGTIVFNLTTGVAQSGWHVTEVLRQTA